jgi:hypothetical protein
MRDGISLRQAVIGGILIVAGCVVAALLYFRSLAAEVLSDAPLSVAEVAPDEAALSRAADAIARARTAASVAVLGEDAANRALFDEWLRDADRQVRLALDPPYSRLRMAQRDRESGRWLNADLVVAPFAAEGGIAFRVLSGTVGAVSISKTKGEWVRMRIEKQLAHDFATNERTAKLFAGVKEVRVEKDGLRVGF